MSCSNCYNGCVEITSDKCVRYTGIDVPVLGIQTGDSLSYVEQALIEFLTSTLDGTGIKLTIDAEIICTLVSQYIPDCEDLTALNLFEALIKAACDLQTQVNAVVADIAVIEADYTISCLDGVAAGDGTHAIVQAIITKLCEIDVDLTALAADVDTNYVKLADLDTLIQAYLDSISPVTQYNARMVPYVAMPYHGSLANFDGSGAGLSANGFDKIYLCNGSNGTPDYRGRSPIGAIQGVPGGAMNPAVDPAFPGNTNYAVNTINGANTVTLTALQMPSHTHLAAVTDPGHFHYEFTTDINAGTTDIVTVDKAVARAKTTGTNLEYEMAAASSTIIEATLGKSSEESTGIAVSISSAGNSNSHNNVHPVIGAYFIMYIP